MRAQLSTTRSLNSTLYTPRAQSFCTTSFASTAAVSRSALRVHRCPSSYTASPASVVRQLHISSLLSRFQPPRSPRVSRRVEPPSSASIPYQPPPVDEDGPQQRKGGTDIGKWTQRAFGIVFLGVYAAFNWDKIGNTMEVAKVMKEKYGDAVDRVSSKERAEMMRQVEAELKLGRPLEEFMSRYFSYSPAKVFPPQENSYTPHNLWTLLAYNFAHNSPTHLLFCYISLGVFMPDFVKAFGVGRTAALFVAGGVTAGTLHTLYERITNPVATVERQKANLQRLEAPENKASTQKAIRSYFANGLGSSSAIVSMATLSCFINPALEVSMLFIPIGIPIRVMIGGMACFDAYGYFIKDWGFGIGHGGHLFGNVAGLILYATLFRRGGFMRARSSLLRYYN